jgi:CheY-like chemotaxis protein
MNKQKSTVRNHRILLVDDDDVLRGWLRAQLESRGCEVWEESQGDEALATYEHNGPWSFVLSDLYFYRGEKIKNGLELVRAITVITPGQRMAIHTSQRDFQAPVPVLIKPYPIGRLLRLLREPLQSLALPFG